MGLGDFNRLDAYRIPDLQFNRKYLEYFSQSKKPIKQTKANKKLLSLGGNDIGS